MNESNPTELMALAGIAMKALEDAPATPTERCAALRLAAFAIEQAMQAQQMAVVMANIVKKSGQ